jgi:exonuclease VII small subunit
VDLHRAGLIVEPFLPQCTTTFYKQILTEQLAAPKPTSAPTATDAQPVLENSNASLTEALDRLTHIQELLTDLQSQVQQSMQQVEKALSKNSNPPAPKKTDEGKDAQETPRRRLHVIVESNREDLVKAKESKPG